MRSYAKNGHCEDNLGTAPFPRIRLSCTIVETCSRHERAIAQAIKYRGVAKRLDLGGSETVHSSAASADDQLSTCAWRAVELEHHFAVVTSSRRPSAKESEGHAGDPLGIVLSGRSIVFPRPMNWPLGSRPV